VIVFLRAAAAHRLAAGFRLAVLYGLRRSELLALRWDDLDLDAGEVRVDEGLVPTWHGHDWTEAKNARSRRTIPIDAATAHAFARHRRTRPPIDWSSDRIGGPRTSCSRASTARRCTHATSTTPSTG
jgi:integrase